MAEDEEDRTLWCGNLSPQVTDELLFELFTQVGPVERVSIPKDKDGNLRSYGFITFKHCVSVPFAMNVLEGTSLFGRMLNMRNRKGNSSTSTQDNQQQYQRGGGYYRSVTMPYAQISHQYQQPYRGSQQYQPYSRSSESFSGVHLSLSSDERYQQRSRDRDRGHHRDRYRDKPYDRRHRR